MLKVERECIKDRLASPNTEEGIYIGRANKKYNLSGSVLANPYIIGKDGTREEVVAKYRKWLWRRIEHGRKSKNSNSVWKTLHSIKERIKFKEFFDESVKLLCWCKKDEACHGDIIIRCLNWMEDSNIKEYEDEQKELRESDEREAEYYNSAYQRVEELMYDQ